MLAEDAWPLVSGGSDDGTSGIATGAAPSDLVARGCTAATTFERGSAQKEGADELLQGNCAPALIL